MYQLPTLDGVCVLAFHRKTNDFYSFVIDLHESAGEADGCHNVTDVSGVNETDIDVFQEGPRFNVDRGNVQKEDVEPVSYIHLTLPTNREV